MNSSIKHARTFSILAAAVSFALFCAAATPGYAASVDPRKIMEDVYRQDTSQTTFMRAGFEIYDNRGRQTKKEFSYRRLGSPGNSKTLVVFTAPKEISGVTLLSVNKQGESSGQYLYVPATGRVRAVAARERSAHFIGTDFSYEDIGERVLDDFTYLLLGETEIMEGHKTWKIEAKPAGASRSQYKYIYYWVAQDAPVILHAEMYDAQGEKIRQMHASQIKHVGGIYGARRTEMSSPRAGTRTVLVIDEVKFNSRMDEKQFTPEGLEHAHDSVPSSPSP